MIQSMRRFFAVFAITFILWPPAAQADCNWGSSAAVGGVNSCNIAVANGYFFMAGCEWLGYSPSASVTGTSWTTAAGRPAQGSQQLTDVAFGNNTYVAVGNINTFWYTDTANVPSNTSDWSSVSGGVINEASGGSRQRVIFANGFFVTTDPLSSSSIIIYSPNGSSWNSASLPSSNDWRHPAFGDGRFVVLAVDGSVAYKASTPIGSWALGAGPGSSSTYSEWRGLEYNTSDGYFYAISRDGYVSRSATGISGWSTPTLISVKVADSGVNSFRIDSVTGIIAANYTKWDNNNADPRGIYWTQDGTTWKNRSRNGQTWFRSVNIYAGMLVTGASGTIKHYLDLKTCDDYDRGCPVGAGIGTGASSTPASFAADPACMLCASGYYSDDMSTVCRPCPAGSGSLSTNPANGATAQQQCRRSGLAYAASKCSGSKSCYYGTSNYDFDCHDYILTSCPAGYYAPSAGPSAMQIDGICVGNNYYRAASDPIGQRTACPAGLFTPGCGVNAASSSNCRQVKCEWQTADVKVNNTKVGNTFTWAASVGETLRDGARIEKAFLLGNAAIAWTDLTHSNGVIKNDPFKDAQWQSPSLNSAAGDFTAIAYSSYDGGMYLALSDKNTFAYSTDLINWTVGTISLSSGSIPAGCDPIADSSYWAIREEIIPLGQEFVTLFGQNCLTNQLLVATINNTTPKTISFKAVTPANLNAKAWYNIIYEPNTTNSVLYLLAGDGSMAFSSAGYSNFSNVSATGLENQTNLLGDFIGLIPVGPYNDNIWLGAMTYRGNYLTTPNQNATGFSLLNSFGNSNRYEHIRTQIESNTFGNTIVYYQRPQGYGDRQGGIYASNNFGSSWTNIPALVPNSSLSNPTYLSPLWRTATSKAWAFGGGSAGQVHYVNLTRCLNIDAICVAGEGAIIEGEESYFSNNCEPCSEGYYSDDNSDSCYKCDSNGAGSNPTYIHGGTGLWDRNMCKINCNAGYYAPAPSSGTPAPACACCPMNAYCENRSGYAYTGANNLNMPSDNDAPETCPHVPNGIAYGTPATCSVLVTSCFAILPHSGANCSGTKKCTYTNSSIGYGSDCRNYALDWCPSGYYYNPSVDSSDGVCVGTDYYRSSTDPIEERSPCPQSPYKTKSGGCGLNAKYSSDCKRYVKLKHSKKTGANDYIIMYNELDPQFVTNPQMCSMLETDKLKYCANFIQSIPSPTGSYSGIDVSLGTGIKTSYGYLTNALPIVKESRSGFEVTLTGMPAGGKFNFQLTAQGNFTVDWGDGTVQNLNYTSTSSTNIHNASGSNVSQHKDKMTGIWGDLGAIFPILGSGYANTPRFYRTFYGTNITSIPYNLFASLSGNGVTGMFEGTFAQTTNLTGTIPAGLFAGITGAPQPYMFYATFAGSAVTGTIPAGLFAGITGTAVNDMFYNMFNGCSGLTGSIPGNLFAGITGAPSNNAFRQTFMCCSGLTGIGNGLFNSLTGNSSGYPFNDTFTSCSSLTGPSATTLNDTTGASQYIYEKWPNARNTGVYAGATGLSDWNCIPTAWGGGGGSCP